MAAAPAAWQRRDAGDDIFHTSSDGRHHQRHQNTPRDGAIASASAEDLAVLHDRWRRVRRG